MNNSPLRRLSPELRNLTYEYTFTDTTVYLDCFKEGGALAQTCKEIRSEARLLSFVKAKFALDVPRIHEWLANPLAKELRPQGAVATILIDIYGAEALGAMSRQGVILHARDEEMTAEIRFDCPLCDDLNGTLCNALPPKKDVTIEKALDDQAEAFEHDVGQPFCRIV